jgi:uncharacterized damage-inducible protein DinB
MADLHLDAAKGLVDDGIAAIRRSVEGLDAELLNRRPAGDDTNSIAVLATHAMHATRLWLTIAVGGEVPERHRASEFATVAGDAETLLRMIDELAADCRAILATPGPIDWSAPRWFTRDDGSGFEVTAAFALLHGVEHLSAHAADASLTRHVWDDA